MFYSKYNLQGHLRYQHGCCALPKNMAATAKTRIFSKRRAVSSPNSSDFFFSLIARINIREVKPIYRREPPHCGWEICCFYQGPVNNEGLADHINQIVQCNKYGNVTVGDINFNSFNNFSVVYNVNCECNVADF
jgi:hypothetical protein